jgi:hypothetical protein
MISITNLSKIVPLIKPWNECECVSINHFIFRYIHLIDKIVPIRLKMKIFYIAIVLWFWIFNIFNTILSINNESELVSFEKNICDVYQFKSHILNINKEKKKQIQRKIWKKQKIKIKINIWLFYMMFLFFCYTKIYFDIWYICIIHFSYMIHNIK